MVDVEYWHMDVFSRYAFQGNGLVVVRDDIGLSTAVQQQLTREVRQFETVFISGVDLLGRTARLRIFTEDEELGFAVIRCWASARCCTPSCQQRLPKRPGSWS
jgi:trans-2,3-dihydro-3-hydroxyanthranilate isomerase